VLVLRWKKEGIKQNDIARRMNTSETTISFILKRYSESDLTTKNHLCGRKRILNDLEIREVQDFVEENRDISGPKLAGIIESNTKKKISPKTAKHYIKINGLKAATPKKVPLISEKNKKGDWSLPKSIS
jgi:transposase